MTRTLQTLRDIFLRSEDVRSPDRGLQSKLGTKYKKGYEIRLTVYSEEELQVVIRTLRMYRVVFGKQFAKGKRFIIPIYGKDTVKRFLHMIGY